MKITVCLGRLEYEKLKVSEKVVEIESEYERKKQDFKVNTTCKRSTRVKVSRKAINKYTKVTRQYILKVTQMYYWFNRFWIEKM